MATTTAVRLSKEASEKLGELAKRHKRSKGRELELLVEKALRADDEEIALAEARRQAQRDWIRREVSYT